MRQRGVELALRHESFDFSESRWCRFISRVVDRGYGIASTDRADIDNVTEVSQLALKQAKRFEERIELLPVPAERGEVEHPKRRELDRDEACEFLNDLKNGVQDRLGHVCSRSELIINHYHSDSTLITSEGTEIREKGVLTDITLYILARDAVQGYASRIIGGRGGYEVIINQPWEDLLDDLTSRVRDSCRAASHPLEGGRFRVILDHEGAGALAHEIAHLLEADLYQSVLFHGLDWGEDVAIIDDPTLPEGYGSLHWDDEGVLTKKKVLLSRQGVNLLHTRLTAKPGDTAGNAHGVTHKPRPMVSNVYLKSSDWRREEIFEETRNGIYAEGVVRAESDARDGRIEIIPEIAYLVREKEVKQPLKRLRIVGNIEDAQRIDAIGRKRLMRPSVEKVYPTSEGGPYIMINGIRCFQ